MPFAIDERDLAQPDQEQDDPPDDDPADARGADHRAGAIAREALRPRASSQHKQFAVGLKGVQQQRTISDTFEQKASDDARVDMMTLDLLVGSGGVLSHAPRRAPGRAACCSTPSCRRASRELAVDSIFMMPQLGVLAEVRAHGRDGSVRGKDCPHLAWGH